MLAFLHVCDQVGDVLAYVSASSPIKCKIEFIQQGKTKNQ